MRSAFGMCRISNSSTHETAMAVARLTRQAENYGISPGRPLADAHTSGKKIQSAATEYFYKTYPTILGSFGAPKTAKVTYPLCAADPMVLL